jgi:hypothetical protein
MIIRRGERAAVSCPPSASARVLRAATIRLSNAVSDAHSRPAEFWEGDRPEAVMSATLSRAIDNGTNFAGVGPTGGVTGRFPSARVLAYSARVRGNSVRCGTR